MCRLSHAFMVLVVLSVSLIAHAQPEKKLKIELVGDSTQTDVVGYGRGFCANLTSEVECLNEAARGSSSKSYREQGLWDKALALHPDYMLIQFGHSDLEAKEHPERQVSVAQYEENLRTFVDQARAARIVPVLVTPLSLRLYGTDGKVHSDLGTYAVVVAKVALEKHVPLVDLHAQSIAYLDNLTEVKADGLGLTKKDTDGKTVSDRTHLNWQGSFTFGRMVAVGMAQAVANLSQYVRPMPAELPAEGVRAMKFFEGAPITIVLVGDSTVATEGGWGPGFCAVMTPQVTCIDDALNGRSSKSFIDEGAWKKALGDHGDYYLIQFGHNDQPGKGPERETDPETTFPANLRRYVADVRATGAVPVLVTSLSRRNYKNGMLVQDLKAYAAATRLVAQEDGVALVDLNALSTQVLVKMTQEQADGFDAATHTDAQAEAAASGNKAPLDRTHLNPGAQRFFGRMVAGDLVRSLPELGPDVVGAATPGH
ncbi:GDSL-type esterase/lipase family protein [Granulicella sibirica]|uniref:Rhamnogalacturonan acetylesterase n=1 Tax=Granulicella sibirica TaxID=2479048 RepID=A0A4Q0SVT2_9BACT|nr:GDSL-type esterase/lipase family protein [Granulicella sibirica]RXH55153.1 rhamnogalacturonan acetylesterase [Granulicella sibirica]